MNNAVISALGPIAKEIWLIGSRANNCETHMSDWDFLVVCAPEQVALVIAAGQSLPDGCDVLITTDKKQYLKRPWLPAEKRSFSDWQWRETGCTATYVGHRFDSETGSDLADLVAKKPSSIRDISGLGTVSLQTFQAVKICGQ